MLSFRNAFSKIGLPTHKPIYNINDPNGLKLLTRLSLGLSHLNKQKLNHNFKECVNPLCSCSLQVESVSQFFWHCHYFPDIRKILFNELQSADKNILNQSNNEMVELLPYGSNKLKRQQNCSILKSSIKFIIQNRRDLVVHLYREIQHKPVFFCLFVLSISNIHFNYHTAFPINLVYIWD